MQPLTLITHIWNEAFFLPYFIRHYRPLFDRAVVIDYDSVDGSRDIIKAMAPEWEVRQSRNEWFDSRACDEEVRDVECEFDGWKFVANATEFLVHEDLRGLLAQLEQRQQPATWAFPLEFVDLPEHANDPLSDAPLYFQKRYGLFWHDRHRLIHNHKHGDFARGRHFSEIAAREADENQGLFICHFGFAPIQRVWHRRFAIGSMSSPRDVAERWGNHHVFDGISMKHFYRGTASAAYNTWERHPTYKRTLDKLAARTL